MTSKVNKRSLLIQYNTSERKLFPLGEDYILLGSGIIPLPIEIPRKI